MPSLQFLTWALGMQEQMSVRVSLKLLFSRPLHPCTRPICAPLDHRSSLLTALPPLQHLGAIPDSPPLVPGALPPRHPFSLLNHAVWVGLAYSQLQGGGLISRSQLAIGYWLGWEQIKLESVRCGDVCSGFRETNRFFNSATQGNPLFPQLV